MVPLIVAVQEFIKKFFVMPTNIIIIIIIQAAYNETFGTSKKLSLYLMKIIR